MILYINCCVRADSRTSQLASALLKKLGAYEEIRPFEANLAPLTKATLERRDKLIACGDYSDPMFDKAKQFAAADTIVIAAPFWDLSFPAELKLYIENIYVTGIVSKYGNDGVPIGLCNAHKLYYITTCGGFFDGRYSYDYIENLALNCFGIKEVELIKAEYLDITGNNPEKIVSDAIHNYMLDR